jgi:hypothetical protein
MVTYSSVSSACYCLDRRWVFKSLATPSYDRTIDSCFHSMHTCLLRATMSKHIRSFIDLAASFLRVVLDVEQQTEDPTFPHSTAMPRACLMSLCVVGEVYRL